MDVAMLDAVGPPQKVPTPISPVSQGSPPDGGHERRMQQGLSKRLTALQEEIIADYQQIVSEREAELQEQIRQLLHEIRCQHSSYNSSEHSLPPPTRLTFWRNVSGGAQMSSEEKPAMEQNGQVKKFFLEPGRSPSNLAIHREKKFCLADDSGLMPDRYVIAPNSRFRVVHELSSVLALAYDAVMTPLIAAWAVRGFAYEVMSMLTLVFWTFDMLLNFFTGYYANGEVVLQQRVIAGNYLRSWFTADLLINGVDLGTLAVDLYFQDHPEHVASYWRAAPLLMRASRLMKVSKLLRIVVFFQRLHERAPGPVASRLAFMGLGTKLASTLLWLNHVICCIWYFIGTREDMSDTGYTWLDISLRSGDMTYREVGPFYQYLTSLHWAFTQMTPGSMSVVPQNSLERFFNVWCLLVGLFVGALLISQLSARMVKMHVENQEQIVRMSKLHTYLKENAVAWTLRTRVQHQILERLQLQKRLTTQDVPLLDLLAPSLRRDLCFSSFAHLLMNHTLFHAWGVADRNLLEDLCYNAVELVILSKDDDLFTPQTPADKVFNVLKGTLRYEKTLLLSHSKPTVDDDLACVDIIEAGSWISEVSLWLEWSYSGTMTGVEQCELLALNVPATLELLQKRPKVKALNHHYALALQRVAVETSTAYDQPDIQPDMESLLMALPLQWRLQVMEPLVYSHHNPRNSSVLSWARLPGNSMDPLIDELRDGKCILLLQNARLERTVPLVVLNVRRRGGADFLIQLAKGVGGKLQVSPQLPGSKLRAGEGPEAAKDRLLQKLFPGLLDKVHVNRTGSFDEVRESATYKILSKYSIYRFEGTFRMPSDYHYKAAKPAGPASSLGSSAFAESTTHCSCDTHAYSPIARLKRSFYRRRTSGLEEASALAVLEQTEPFLMMSDQGEQNLYAWISEPDFNSLKLPKGQEALRNWLHAKDGQFMVLDEDGWHMAI